ncbi:MAG: DUF4178 domain-containing protein [Oscillatoriales cyanobacterium C42_A2020_001]|nr:DUF4178 domain-containing protein [Leptolyngbyaceae cyanobacterium C42_A2020_001]
MLTWVWLGIIAIAVVGTVIVIRQRMALPHKKEQDALPSLQRTVFTLQIGDIVQYEGVDWVVEGRLTFDDSGYSWFEYMLQDNDTIRWLSVEEDDRVEVLWMEPAANLDISGEPPNRITYAGTTYQQVEQGSARMTRIGTTMNKQAQRCRYFEYTAPNGQVLSVENWDGDIEVSVGKRIRPSSLLLLPGDGRRVYDD